MIPVVVVYRSGMISHRHIQMAQQLRELYETTRITNARVDTRESIKELLERVCTMFNAQGASIVFFAREGESSPYETLIDLDKDTFLYMEPTVLDPTKGIWARAASESRALRLASPIENANLKAHYASMGIKDVMVAPMMADDRPTGIIRVWNRRGDTQTFTSEDLRLFETVANHASIAMENARLITQLEDSLAHLTEMNQLKDDFVASVSHELRTPLTSIRGYVMTLLRTDANFNEADTRSFLETIDRQSNRLHRLIEDLLAVSRIESESDPSTMTTLALRTLADEVADELRLKAGGHVIDVLVPDDLPMVHTDAGKVHQIVSNLVDNALKYSPEGTRVEMAATPSSGGVTISVSDHGSGVPDDLRDQIFERFYQVDQSATRSVGGAGLGLYICRRMAEAIGARVWLEASDENGSTFSLWIPTNNPLVIKTLRLGTTN
jgi:K+-sensing histidine kinase KdpD